MTRWEDGGEPVESGWYAIHYCWDSDEGSLVNSSFYDGVAWTESLPIIDTAGPFLTEGEADAFCDHNDISF